MHCQRDKHETASIFYLTLAAVALAWYYYPELQVLNNIKLIFMWNMLPVIQGTLVHYGTQRMGNESRVLQSTLGT